MTLDAFSLPSLQTGPNSITNSHSVEVMSGSLPPLSGAWWKPARTVLPGLPPEIWCQVMLHATFVPQALATQPLDPFEQHVHSHTKLLETLHQSMKLKRTLSRVCRTWHTLATPLLYKTVALFNGRAVQSFASALEASAVDEHDGFSIGQYVRRMDIVLRSQDPSLREVGFLDKLFAAFRHAPHLEILSLQTPRDEYVPGRWGENMRHGLVYRLPHLRTLIWPVAPDIEASSWLEAISRAPSLTVCHGLNIPIKEVNVEHFQIIMRCLTSFAIRFEQTESGESTVEPISSEHSSEIIFGPQCWDNFDPFPTSLTSVVGTVITRIVFETSAFKWYIQEVLDNFAVCCPRLKQLVLIVDDWSTLQDSQRLVVPPKVEQLGLSSHISQHKSRYYRALASRFRSMEAPRLHTVKFLRQDNVKDLRKHHLSLADIARTLTSRSIRACDHENLPLHERSDP